MSLGDINPPNHYLFQLANFVTLISFASWDPLWLRIIIVLSCIIYAIWGIFVLRIAVDTLAWNVLFFIIHFTLMLQIIK